MNIAFRYGQEYRNITHNQIFLECTGRKLPFAKYSFPPFVVSTHIRPNLYVQRKQKKLPIWALFVAPQFLCPQHFLHCISDDIYGPIYVLNNKISKKN